MEHRILAAGVLAAAVTAAGVLPAHAGPRITVTVSKGESSRPLQHHYNLHLPALSGASRKAERTFGKIVASITDQELAMLLRWRNGNSPTPGCNSRTQNSQMRTRTRKAIVDGRYATATVLSSTWPACGGVDQVDARTINLDLRTGESLHLDRLISRSATYPVVAEYLSYGARAVNGETCDAEMYKRPSLYNWVLKPHGIQFWFDKYAVSAGYCGAVSVTIPWRDLPLKAQGERLADEVR